MIQETKKEIAFALYCIKKNFQSAAELRASFLMSVLGMTITDISFIAMWSFFSIAVGKINGWTAIDMVGLMGFDALCYGIVFAFFGGILKLPQYTANGSFDRFMLSPKNVLLRVLTSAITVSGFGDIACGTACLVIYGIAIHATAYQAMLAVLLVGITTILFFAITVIVHTTAFIFTDSESVTRAAFELFLAPALFHGGAFQGGMRLFFIFVVPSLLVGTLPVEVMRDMNLHKLALIFVISILWFIASIFIFYRGIKKYESANMAGFAG